MVSMDKGWNIEILLLDWKGAEGRICVYSVLPIIYVGYNDPVAIFIRLLFFLHF